jgi:hypothetical protein
VSKRKQKSQTSSKKSPAISSATASKKKSKRRIGSIIRSVVALVVLVMAAGAGITALNNNYDTNHDLSVIGQGLPTIVQIHDPSCQLCIRLRSNAKSALGRIAGEDVLFRVADITTPKGRLLQSKHNVPHVTLLLFDRDGKLSRTLNGVKTDDFLHQAFLAHINSRANRARLEAKPDDA